MTAHAGDALPHVYFRPPPSPYQVPFRSPFKSDFQAIFGRRPWPRFGHPARPEIGSVAGRYIRSGAICMGAMSHPGGSVRRFHLLLRPDFATAHEDYIDQ